MSKHLRTGERVEVGTQSLGTTATTATVTFSKTVLGASIGQTVTTDPVGVTISGKTIVLGKAATTAATVVSYVVITEEK